MSLPKRLRDKIEFKHAATPELTACWIWTGYTRDGYPMSSEGSENVPAHRLIWEKLRGPIPEGRNLLRACPRPACVNPNHMEIRGNAA